MPTRPARRPRRAQAVLLACLLAVTTACGSADGAAPPAPPVGDGVRYGGGVEDAVPPVLADVRAPAAATPGGGIPIGPGGVGTVGSGDVVVEVYLDPACPWCQRLEQMYGDALLDLVEAGGVTLVHRPLAFLDARWGGTYSTRAVHALAVVADAAPEHYPALHRQLLAHQPEAGEAAGLDDDAIATIALDAGVPADVVARFTASVSTEYRVATADGGSERRGATSRVLAPWVAAATQQAYADLGEVGVPTVLVDGERVEDWSEPGSLTARVSAAVAARG
jgi:protein-disulfide isomerase